MLAAGTTGFAAGLGIMITSNVLAGLIVIIVISGGAIVGIFFNNSETMKIVKDLKRLEERVNDLAGDQLLTHETGHGLAAEGHIQRWRKFVAGSSN